MDDFHHVQRTNGSGYPYVSSFDVTGGGAQNAGTFDVGEVSYTGLFEGGGVWQDFTTSGGLATLSFDWASWDQPNESQNADGGQFALVLDGVTLASYDIGNINSGQVVRGSFSVNDTLTPGTHQFEILIERPYVSCGFDCTPQQFVTNASVLGNSGGTTPEPGTLLLFGSGLVGLAGVVRRKRG